MGPIATEHCIQGRPGCKLFLNCKYISITKDFANGCTSFRYRYYRNVITLLTDYIDQSFISFIQDRYVDCAVFPAYVAYNTGKAPWDPATKSLPNFNMNFYLYRSQMSVAWCRRACMTRLVHTHAHTHAHIWKTWTPLIWVRHIWVEAE